MVDPPASEVNASWASDVSSVSFNNSPRGSPQITVFRSAAAVTISFLKVVQRRIVHHGTGQQPLQLLFSFSSVFSRLASETSSRRTSLSIGRCWRR